MGIAEKIAKAKETTWLSEGLSEAEVKTTVELAKISAQIERRRLDMHMSQKEFAEYMGVSQGMISKWESREYNFTIKSLNEICQKLDLKFNISFDSLYAKTDYKIVEWNQDYIVRSKRKSKWTMNYTDKEAIA
nr:helix-turn-helix domain-containing protein [Clostridium sp. Marseille-P7770]